MINKKTFIFNTLAEALAFKIGADPKNTTYRLGSFAEDVDIKEAIREILREFCIMPAWKWLLA